MLFSQLLTFSSGTKRQSVPVASLLLGKIKLDSGFPQISHCLQKTMCTNSHAQKKTHETFHKPKWFTSLFTQVFKIKLNLPCSFCRGWLSWLGISSHCLTYFSSYLLKSRCQGCLTVDLFYSSSVADGILPFHSFHGPVAPRLSSYLAPAPQASVSRRPFLLAFTLESSNM